MLLSSREKILLHLYLESRNRQVPARVMSAKFSQEGISDGTGVARKHIPRNLKTLMAKEHIREDKAHIKGAAQRRKVYFPTPEGREEALGIQDRALSAEVTYVSEEGRKELSLEKAIKEFNLGHKDMGDPGLMIFIRSMVEKGVKEILAEERVLSTLGPGERQVKHLSSAPVVREFVGRERDSEKVIDLMKERKLVVIYGITGIGKSALASQLARTHQGSVFWYAFHEWDTLGNLQKPLGRFIDDLGRGSAHLKEGISDINEFLGFLKDGLRDTGTLIVLDDVQKAPLDFQSLLQGIIANLATIEGFRFLMFSRKIPDFYSRKDVVVRKTVGEYMLEGLDRESCRTLLNSRGISEEDSEEIYRITCGHPLSLELIETPGAGINAGNLERYFEEEILRKLPASEKQILRQASVYRYPVPPGALLLLVDQDHENISNLQRNALLLQTSDGNYLLHDLLKGFMTSQLSILQRTEVHENAAEFYRTQKEERSSIEAIYHQLQSENYEEAKEIILRQGRELIYRGYGKELHDYFDKLTNHPLSDRDKADLLTLHAEIDTVTGDWNEAEDHLSEALKLYQALGYSVGTALVLKDLGGLQLRKGVQEEAVKIFQESLSYYLENNDLNGIAKIENNLGIAFWQGGEIEKAKESLGKSLKLSERTADTQGIARALTNLGIIEFQHGDPDRAIDFYNRALSMSRELGDKKTIAQLYDNLGEAYREKGDRDRAMEFFDRGIELAETHGFRLITAQLYKDMSELLKGDEQEYYHGLAKEICEELGIKEE